MVYLLNINIYGLQSLYLVLTGACKVCRFTMHPMQRVHALCLAAKIAAPKLSVDQFRLILFFFERSYAHLDVAMQVQPGLGGTCISFSPSYIVTLHGDTTCTFSPFIIFPEMVDMLFTFQKHSRLTYVSFTRASLFELLTLVPLHNYSLAKLRSTLYCSKCIRDLG